jgi:hypothetical protein
MIKVLKYNCKDLNFKTCPKCFSLLQFKESDIKWESIGQSTKIVGKIQCPQCNETVQVDW